MERCNIYENGCVYLVETEVALDGVRGEKHLAIAGQDEQETVEGLMNLTAKQTTTKKQSELINRSVSAENTIAQ